MRSGRCSTQPAGAAHRALLLVGRAGVRHRAGERRAGRGQAPHRHGVGGDEVLDVDGAAAPHVAVLDEAGEGRHLPVGGVGRHHVLVREQQQRRARAAGPRGAARSCAGRPARRRSRPRRPASRNQRSMNSATAVSLPGGLLVSMRMSRLSSSLVSRSTSATTAGSRPTMSTALLPCCTTLPTATSRGNDSPRGGRGGRAGGGSGARPLAVH